MPRRCRIHLGTVGECGQPAGLTHGQHLIAAAGKNLVGIALVPYIPDQFVIRRIEDMVQGNGQLDYTETCPKMPAGFTDRIQQVMAQFSGNSIQLLLLQLRANQPGNLCSRAKASRAAQLEFFKHSKDLMQKIGCILPQRGLDSLITALLMTGLERSVFSFNYVPGYAASFSTMLTKGFQCSQSLVEQADKSLLGAFQAQNRGDKWPCPGTDPCPAVCQGS